MSLVFINELFKGPHLYCKNANNHSVVQESKYGFCPCVEIRIFIV